MKSIQLGGDLGVNSILTEEACTQIIVIKGTVLKNTAIHMFETSLEASGMTSIGRI